MSKDLINVIDDLLNEKAKGGAMTSKDTVINPQEKKPMKEEDIKEFNQNADNAKSLTSDGKTADTATIKPSGGKEASSVEADKGPHDQAGENAGDEGDMNKGKIASAASSEIEADKGPHDQSTDNAGDTNSIDGISAKPSQASGEVEANKGPHDQSNDPGMSEQAATEDDESVDEKKLDAVGKEDGDVDNDGDKDKSDDYLMKRRAAIKKSMASEEVTWEDAMYVLHSEELSLKESTGAFEWDKIKDLDESQWYLLVGELDEAEENTFAEEIKNMAISLDAMETPTKAEAEEEYGRELTDEEYDHICESKYHLCAVVVEHPEWGEGKPIIGRHAKPDDEGNIEWYDVEFEHGIEEEVPVEGMNIVHEMSHGPSKAKKKMKETMKKNIDTSMGEDKVEEGEKVKPGSAFDRMPAKSPGVKMGAKIPARFKPGVPVGNQGAKNSFKKEEIEDKVEEALPAGEPMQKLGDAKGQDTSIQSGSNDKQLPSDDKKASKGEAESKGGDVASGPHTQANDPIETPTSANPKGPAKMAKASAAAEPNKGPHDQANDPIVNKMPEETEQSNDIESELDEDFKRKAAVVFETAVNEKVEQYKETLREESEKSISEEKEALNAKVQEYVDYAVKEWLKENELEIKYSLRTEVAENFITGMRNLFAENYIDIPEDDISVVDEITEQIDSFKEQAEEYSTLNEKLQKEVLELKKNSIVETVAEGLTETQKIKLEKLSGSVEAEDTIEFQTKLEDLKQVYFNEGEESKKLLGSLSEEVIGTDEVIAEESDDSSVNAYAQFLTKTIKK